MSYIWDRDIDADDERDPDEGPDPYETRDGIELDLKEYLEALADRLPKEGE